MTAVTVARERVDNSILVDGGDQFKGTLFYIYYKGMLAAEMMNKLGYDGMTVGNHQFDDGPEVLIKFMVPSIFRLRCPMQTLVARNFSQTSWQNLP